MIRIAILGGGFIGQLLKATLDKTVNRRAIHTTIYDWRPAPPPGMPPPTQNRSLGPQYLWERLEGFDHVTFPVVTTVDGLPEGHKKFAAAVKAYKRKIGREDDSGREGQFAYQSAGFEPKLPEVAVRFGYNPLRLHLDEHRMQFVGHNPVGYDVLISTIPLPVLARLAGVPGADEFKSKPIHVVVGRAVNPVRGVVVNYLSDPKTPVYRQTTRGTEIHTESLEPMPGSRVLKPGKIVPCERAVEVRDTLAQQRVFCFGRFATWNDDELAHDTHKEFCTWLTAKPF